MALFFCPFASCHFFHVNCFGTSSTPWHLPSGLSLPNRERVVRRLHKDSSFLGGAQAQLNARRCSWDRGLREPARHAGHAMEKLTYMFVMMRRWDYQPHNAHNRLVTRDARDAPRLFSRWRSAVPVFSWVHPLSLTHTHTLSLCTYYCS